MKNKAKNSSTNKGVDKWQRLNLPPQILQLLRTSKTSPLHHVTITCTTKWWVPPATRSTRTRYPEFRHLGISSAQHFYGDYIIHNAAATDSRQVMAYSGTDRAWVGYESDPLDPFDTKKKCTEFFTGINLEKIDARLAITGIHINKGAPSANWRLFEENLFEMDGELFLIFLIHKKSIEIVDHVEVFRLCFDELKWIKMERLEGKTVFLDRYICWVNSGEIGCRGDCVYFTQGQDNEWWVYDMQGNYISVVDSGSDFLLHNEC